MSDVPERVLQDLTGIAKAHGYVNPEIVVHPVDSGGANYSSRLFAITISAEGKSDLKLFAKLAVLSEEIRSLINIQVFEIEKAFYTNILSKYRELEERHGVAVEDRLILPKYYGLEYMKETIFLEDLRIEGYQAFDRFKCFDWEYASKCVSVLASLHALSVAYQKYDPSNFKQLTERCMLEYPLSFVKETLHKNMPNAFAATEEVYRPKLEQYIKETMNDENLDILFNGQNSIVLTHGDFRPSNIVHKRDKDGTLKVVVLDHQTIQIGDPPRDLVYFLICGSDEEFREKHLQQLIDHYYEEFSRNLRSLAVDPEEVYTEEQYRKDIKGMLPLGLLLGMYVLPVITIDEENAPKLTDGIDMDSLDVKEVNHHFRVRFNGLVKDYVKLGFL